MKEEWRAVPGYEGLYEVSNMGRVRSLDRWVDRPQGGYLAKGKELKGWVNKAGYRTVLLYKGEGRGNGYVGFHVHRLVAKCFIPNPNRYGIINHKDENPRNNRVDNLEWCTQSYNVNYGTGKDRNYESNRKHMRMVEKLDMNGEYICTYNSVREAGRLNGLSFSNIQKCCANKPRFKSVGGYKWKYKTE